MRLIVVGRWGARGSQGLWNQYGLGKTRARMRWMIFVTENGELQSSEQAGHFSKHNGGTRLDTPGQYSHRGVPDHHLRKISGAVEGEPALGPADSCDGHSRG